MSEVCKTCHGKGEVFVYVAITSEASMPPDPIPESVRRAHKLVACPGCDPQRSERDMSRAYRLKECEHGQTMPHLTEDETMMCVPGLTESARISVSDCICGSHLHTFHGGICPVHPSYAIAMPAEDESLRLIRELTERVEVLERLSRPVSSREWCRAQIESSVGYDEVMP